MKRRRATLCLISVFLTNACIKTGPSTEDRASQMVTRNKGTPTALLESSEPLCLKPQPTGYADRLSCKTAPLFVPLVPVSFNLTEETFLQVVRLPVFVQTQPPPSTPNAVAFADGRRRRLQESILYYIKTLRDDIDASIQCAQKNGDHSYPGGTDLLRDGIAEFLNGGPFNTRSPWGSVLAIGVSERVVPKRIPMEYRDVQTLKEKQTSRLYYLGLAPSQFAGTQDASEWAERLFFGMLPYWDSRRTREPQEEKVLPLGGCFASLARRVMSAPATKPLLK